MANIVIIQKLIASQSAGKDAKGETNVSTDISQGEKYVYPLLEDVTFDYQSEVGDMLDGIPMLDTITNLFNVVNSLSAAGGTVSKGNLAMEQFMQAPRWKKTQPVKFPVKILLYTKTDVYNDVWSPAKDFISMTILQKQKDGTYITPGLNLNDLESAAKSATEKNPAIRKGSFISIEIPGMIYLPMAFIEKTTPIFSKEVAYSNTKFKNFPIWCELELQISGVYPATTEFLDMVCPTPGTGGMGTEGKAGSASAGGVTNQTGGGTVR